MIVWIGGVGVGRISVKFDKCLGGKKLVRCDY